MFIALKTYINAFLVIVQKQSFSLFHHTNPHKPRDFSADLPDKLIFTSFLHSENQLIIFTGTEDQGIQIQLQIQCKLGEFRKERK